MRRLSEQKQTKTGVSFQTFTLTRRQSIVVAGLIVIGSAVQHRPAVQRQTAVGKEFDVASGFFVPTISAQNSGSGKITCRIIVDGAVVSEITSDGQYTIASCVGDAIM